jgi:hypothetical protein
VTLADDNFLLSAKVSVGFKSAFDAGVSKYARRKESGLNCVLSILLKAAQ